MTKIIGLTGGIGSGKTTIARYFKSLGIPVYISDDEAKKLMQSQEVIDKVKSQFPVAITLNNTIDNKILAEIVFKNPENLSKLNAIVHPIVHEHFKNWVKSHSKEKIVIKEAAILFESGSYKDCDAIISVVAPLEQRINRVILRDNMTKEQIEYRVSNQWSDEQRIANSNYVIHNSTVKFAYIQAQEILKKLYNI
jgi:dephospho-CoA kinase